MLVALTALALLQPAVAADPAPATVRHISDAPTRSTPSGTAAVMRLAGS